jgi:hypothetical protein
MCVSADCVRVFFSVRLFLLIALAVVAAQSTMVMVDWIDRRMPTYIHICTIHTHIHTQHVNTPHPPAFSTSPGRTCRSPRHSAPGGQASSRPGPPPAAPRPPRSTAARSSRCCRWGKEGRKGEGSVCVCVCDKIDTRHAACDTNQSTYVGIYTGIDWSISPFGPPPPPEALPPHCRTLPVGVVHEKAGPDGIVLHTGLRLDAEVVEV